MQFYGRTLVFALLLGVTALASGSRGASAADFPTKTVRIVIPFSAGGAPDVKDLSPRLSEKWKQPVVIENRPGANTNLGWVVVTKAEADGHILLFTTDGTFIFNALIYSSLPYAVFATDLAYWSSHNDFAGRNQAMHARSSLHRQLPH